jgi:hypothetical protein
MEPVQSSSSENNARAAREAALSYRPNAAPLPPSIGWAVDTEHYQTAAQQYFESARQFYEAGDYARGDYCIVRGDRYLLLASVVTQVSSMGVSPLLTEKPEEQAPIADEPSDTELEAKYQQLSQFLNESPVPVPSVPAEASNASQCESFHQRELSAVSHAIRASDEHNLVGVYYWLDEAHSAGVLYDICLQIEQAISHSH